MVHLKLLFARAAALGLLAAADAGAECIRVLVRDPAGLPIAGAVVRSGKQLRAESNPAGAARLCGLTQGRYNLSIEAADFAAASLAADAPGERTVTLALQPRIESPVVVTGTPEPKQLAEVDRSIAVIPVPADAAPATSFADLLKTDTSIDVRERGPDNAQADAGIRGGVFSQTLVLINGMRVSDPQAGHHNMDIPLPLEAVSRMEVLHGSGSTLYGSDSVGGAVNIITRKPDARELSLSSGLGDFGWNREGIAGGFRRGAWGQHLSLSRDFSSGFQPGRDFRNLAAASESFFDESFGSTSVLFAYNDRPFGANGFYGAYPSWESTGTKLLAISQTAGAHRFQFSYRRHLDHYVLYRDNPEIFQNFHTAGTWYGSYAYHHSLSAKTELTVGLDALSESISSTNLGDHRRERASSFFVVQARPGSRLSLSAGLREEVYRKWRGVISPTLSAGVRLGKGFKARAGLGHGFRVPTYTDLYYHDPANIGNPHLRPESAWTYEAGLDWWSRAGTVGATWFERRERDTIDFTRPAGAGVWQALNFERLHFHGGEIEWRRRVRSSGELSAGYTILRASRELTAGVVSRYVFNFPRSSLVLSGTAPVGRYATVRTRIGVFNRSWQSTVGIWDFSLVGRPGRLHPFVQVTNLLNTYYEAFPGLAQPGRWIRGGLRLDLLGRR